MRPRLQDNLMANAAALRGQSVVNASASSYQLFNSANTSDGLDARRSTIAIAVLVSVLLAVCGLAASGSQSSVPLLLLFSSSTVAIATTVTLLNWELRFGARKLSRSGYSKNELEQKIETLEDLRWQARDDADHLQALLDAQAAIILKRDANGKITFVNRTFCKAFGVGLTDVTSKSFWPPSN